LTWRVGIADNASTFLEAVVSIIGFTGSALHWSAPFTESVAVRDGDRTANLDPPSATVTTEFDGFARNRIRFHIACEECGGTGRYTLDGGNNPYARIYECEACEGAGMREAQDEELEA